MYKKSLKTDGLTSWVAHSQVVVGFYRSIFRRQASGVDSACYPFTAPERSPAMK